MPYRYSIETCQDHPKKSTMYLFYPSMPGLNASRPQCLNAIGGRRHEAAGREDPPPPAQQRAACCKRHSGTSSNPFCSCKYFSNLLSKVLGRPRLRARTALPPVKLRQDRGPWTLQEALRSPQDRPKTPKIGPKRPQDRPKIVLRRPRSAQDRPKRPQDRPKMRQDRPKMPPERSKSGQESSWNDLGVIMRDLGAILGSNMFVFHYVFQYFL